VGFATRTPAWIGCAGVVHRRRMKSSTFLRDYASSGWTPHRRASGRAMTTMRARARPAVAPTLLLDAAGFGTRSTRIWTRPFRSRSEGMQDPAGLGTRWITRSYRTVGVSSPNTSHGEFDRFPAIRLVTVPAASHHLCRYGPERRARRRHRAIAVGTGPAMASGDGVTLCKESGVRQGVWFISNWSSCRPGPRSRSVSDPVAGRFSRRSPLSLEPWASWSWSASKWVY